jgi:hypothetical protein
MCILGALLVSSRALGRGYAFSEQELVIDYTFIDLPTPRSGPVHPCENVRIIDLGSTLQFAMVAARWEL